MEFDNSSKAVIDIGSQNIVCLLGRRVNGGVQVLGHSRVPSQGVEAGTIVNMKHLKEAVATAIHNVEKMADCEIKEVMVNLSCGRPYSRLVTENYEFKNLTIVDEDLKQGIKRVRKIHNKGDYVIRAIPIDYNLDGVRVKTPVGMSGTQLRVTYHLVSVNLGAWQNLKRALNECGLEVIAYVPTPLAAALGVLIDEEFVTGITVIDLGAETTSLGIFDNGQLVHSEQIQNGNSVVTRTIAQGFMTPMFDAERIKIFYGAAVVDGAVTDGDDPTIDVPIIHESYPTKVAVLKQSVLHQVVTVPLTEILQEMHRRLQRPEFSRYRHHRIILTGGGSLMAGITQLVQEIFGQEALIRTKVNLHRPPAELNRGNSAVVAGLLIQFIRTPHLSAGRKAFMDLIRDLKIRRPTIKSKKLLTPQPATNR
ncbi:MAG: cell division protein FtsA [Candidatus Pacebacteria bacterium]|nr:cell division protein FtsA [Candidatus Paceibacterota bacterium]